MAGQHSDIDHTGLTGTGIPLSLVTAKGDLIVATGSGAVDNLAVGANDTIPMADSGQATGIKWVAAGMPVDQDYDDAAAVGTADTFARGDHRHGMPAEGGGGGLASGSSNPGSPSAGDLFFRTDLGRLIYYDGTRWLTNQLFEINWVNGLTPNSLSPFTMGALALGGVGIWWVDHHFSTTNVGTNNGSNYWGVALHDQQNAGGADTTIGSVNTSAAGAPWNVVSGALGVASTAPVIAYALMSKTGTPGNTYWAYKARFREIVT